MISKIFKLFERLKKSKKHRKLFVESQVKADIPFQIRAMRDERNWTQEQLGQALGMPQSVISRMENPDSGFLSIKTLLRVASVFDVALIVRFAPFSELMHWTESVPYTVQGLTPEALALTGFEKDSCFEKDDFEVELKTRVSVALRGENSASTPIEFTGLS